MYILENMYSILLLLSGFDCLCIVWLQNNIYLTYRSGLSATGLKHFSQLHVWGLTGMSQKGSVQCFSNNILRTHVNNQILLTKAIYLLKINNNLGLTTFTNFWWFKPSGKFFTILLFPSCVQKSSISLLVPPSVLIINKKAHTNSIVKNTDFW